MTDYDYLTVRDENRVRFLTLSRPDKLNALNDGLRMELEDALVASEEEDKIRAVVLTGKGRAFSVGYDFGEAEGKDISPEDYMGKIYSHVDVIYELDLPVVAAVDGYALAGGCNLALICDLTIATERSTFGFPDVRMAVIPPRLVVASAADSIKDARELLYGGKHVDADRAAEMGLVNYVVGEDELMDAVHDEIDTIKKTPSSVVKLLKDSLNDVQEDQGYRAGSAAKVDEYLMALSTATETANRFGEIRDEEGVNAAVEWMNEADKD